MAIELLKGTLDVLILRTLSLGPNHGLGIARRIEQLTNGAFEVKPGSLFPALYRLEEKGWLVSEWRESGVPRRAKYYQLTKSGRKQAQVETEAWTRIADAMALAIKATS